MGPHRWELVHRLGVVGKARAQLLGCGCPVASPGEINARRITVHKLRELVLQTGGALQRGGVGLGLRRSSPERYTGQEEEQEDTEREGSRVPVEMRHHDCLLCQSSRALVERPPLPSCSHVHKHMRDWCPRPMGGYALAWHCCPVTVSFCTLVTMKKGSSRFGPAIWSSREAQR